MTWPAVLSGTALRDLRTAAGRRALEVALLVGGLFVLGFLCGGQAHAAETTTTVTAPAVSTSTVTAPAVSTSTVTAPAVSTSPETASTVTAPVVTLAEAQREAPPLRPNPSVPSMPSLPGLPELPKAPSPPTLPGWSDGPDFPGLPPLPGQPPPTPVTSTPLPAGQTPDTPASPSDESGRRPHQHAGTAATTALYGPLPAVVGTAHGAAAHDHASRAARPGHVPEQHAPGGGSSGVLGSQAAFDNGTSRHGDGHAVTSHHPVPPALMPGTTSRTDAAGTRDRYRDIPLFPA
ncbi:hypothetical protein ACFYWX_07090 [Streptomyces sp. NPDC002888]|uniref:hypothetical protein n=1 Tax=Streptomyces sp. NPDC002888 TaxID=3364668 RepID=UPI0036AF6723